MIPTPVSIAPLTSMLVVAIAGLVYAAAKAGLALRVIERGTRVRTVAIGVTAVAGAFALAMLTFLIYANVTHGSKYNTAAWGSLAKNYGVYSAVSGQDFKPNLPFPALHHGQATECTVSPPETVLCNGQRILPLTTP